MIDSHCHLYDKKIPDNIDYSSLKYVLTSSDNISSTKSNLLLSDKHPNIYFTAGIHPHNVDDITENYMTVLKKLSAHPKCLGIGETGIDLFYEISPEHLQTDIFIKHIELSISTGKPLIIHSRKAENKVLNLLMPYKNSISGILHCYTGPENIFKKFISEFPSLYYSFGGIITFKKADDIRNLLSICPIEKLLLETDSPYLSPVPLRGRINTPLNIKHIYESVSKLKKIHIEELIKIINKNFTGLFKELAG